jgi:hypothetical protein
MLIKMFLVAMLLALAPISRLTCQNRSPGRERAVQLWQQMIAAKGGHARLEAVATMLQTQGDRLLAVRPGLKNTKTELVRLFVFPDRVWQWFDGGSTAFGTSLRIDNLGLALHFLGLPGEVRRTEGASGEPARHQLWEAQLIYLSETAWLRPDLVQVLAEPDLPNVDAIETKVTAAKLTGPKLADKEERVDFYLDKRTHLPVQVVDYGWEPSGWKGRDPELIKVYYKLSKYTNVGGVMIPGSVVQTLFNNSTEWDYVIRLNAPYREDAFTETPTMEAGAYAWEPRAPR